MSKKYIIGIDGGSQSTKVVMYDLEGNVVCEGFDDNVDADNDGIPDGCDICALGDDTADTDGDGIPDSCDLCEGSDPTRPCRYGTSRAA